MQQKSLAELPWGQYDLKSYIQKVSKRDTPLTVETPLHGGVNLSITRNFVPVGSLL